jgi:enamine deaminase RidA (YjgF/YER057c/UK114 family)
MERVMGAAVQYLNPEGACPAQGLYSHATRVTPGPMYFIAGQLSVAADGSVAGSGDFAAQFHQVFANLGDVLRGLGASYNDVVKFTTYLVHAQDIPNFMRLRAEVFPTLFATALLPPNTLLVVDRLVKEEFLIEVEAIVRAPD